ncbi:MAG: DUF488 family protein [Halorhabdus sp.]
MSEHGRLRDTYVAAIQHDLVELPPETLRLGVVRRPTQWFRPHVDENEPVLGPPDSLLDEFRTRYEQLEMEGLSDEEAHNTAWDEIEYDQRYRSYLAESEEAQDAIQRIVDLVTGGTDVALVCFENTEQKRCHRTLLRDEIERVLDD